MSAEDRPGSGGTANTEDLQELSDAEELRPQGGGFSANSMRQASGIELEEGDYQCAAGSLAISEVAKNLI